MKKILYLLVLSCAQIGSKELQSHLYRAKLPIAYCNGYSYVGLTLHDTGMWGDAGPVSDANSFCDPEIFSPRGDYSVVYSVSDYCPDKSGTLIWVPLDRLIVALKKNSRIVCSSLCTVMLLDQRLFMVLKSQRGLERLEQITPDKSGLCHIEY